MIDINDHNFIVHFIWHVIFGIRLIISIYWASLARSRLLLSDNLVIPSINCVRSVPCSNLLLGVMMIPSIHSDDLAFFRRTLETSEVSVWKMDHLCILAEDRSSVTKHKSNLNFGILWISCYIIQSHEWNHTLNIIWRVFFKKSHTYLSVYILNEHEHCITQQM